jgi:pSer/pThr/pTyr-binding forkhead associated (FHA) protein
MVLLRILAGPQAGQQIVARQLPVRIGRASVAHLRLQAEGVWDDHCQILQEGPGGLSVLATSEALVLVNGEPIHRARLRNGDLLEVGAIKLQFGLSPAAQLPLWGRELFGWLLVAGATAAQGSLLVWLTR